MGRLTLASFVPTPSRVIPAKAGINSHCARDDRSRLWIPAFAGMTRSVP